MNGSWKDSLIKQLRDKRFRTAYVAEDIRTGIAFQIRALREGHGWSQAELGRQSGKPQSVIARMEDPDYGRFSLKTLLDMTSAFDVALLVRFVSFSELVRRNMDLSPDTLCVPAFSHDDLVGETNQTASDGSNVVNLLDRMQTVRTGSDVTLRESQQDQQPRSDPSGEFFLVMDDHKTA